MVYLGHGLLSLLKMQFLVIGLQVAVIRLAGYPVFQVLRAEHILILLDVGVPSVPIAGEYLLLTFSWIFVAEVSLGAPPFRR